MLTQFQIPEPQAAVLAACPRPRALAATPVLMPTVPMPSVPSRLVWAGVSRLGAVAEERRGLVAERTRAFGFASVERPVRYAAVARPVGAGILGGDGTTGTTSNKQDQQHLTNRRGPVTWRPPH